MKFLVRQKFWTLKDGFYITDENGENKYYVRGRFISIGKKFNLEDLSGNSLLYIKQRLFRIFPRYDIKIGNDKGETIAVLKRKFSVFVKRYKLKTKKFGTMKIKGNVFAWDFTIKNKMNQDLGYISKKLLRVTDTYMVEVEDPNLYELFLAVSIALDAIHHNAKSSFLTAPSRATGNTFKF